MDLDVKALGRLARACRKHGISHLKTDSLEVSLLPERPKLKEPKPKGPRLIEVKLPDTYQNLTDDELLFGSAK